jgi:hypothetical protein
MEQAGLARIIRQCARLVLEVHERDAVDAESCTVRVALQHGKANRIAIEARNPVEVAHHQCDRIDRERRRGCRSGRGERARRVHGGLSTLGAAETILETTSWKREVMSMTGRDGCRMKRRSAIGRPLRVRADHVC